ncbi:hypothetical protein PV326_013133, partial [Microctonus aethiopoides]
RNNRPAGGVAIYQNMNTVHYCTNYMDVHAKYTSMFNATVSDIGDMCCYVLDVFSDLITSFKIFIEGLKSRELGVVAHPPLHQHMEEIQISATCRRKGVSKSYWKQRYVRACFSTSNCSILQELEAGTRTYISTR